MNSQPKEPSLLEGEVTLDHEICYSGLSPKLRVGGFSLWRLETKDGILTRQVAIQGPHFHLSLPTQPLIFNNSRESLLTGVHYVFSGPRLGEVEELGGIAARDGCGLTRFVDSIDMKVRLINGVLTLAISGTFAPIRHTMERAASRNAFRDVSNFGIRCLIPTSAIPAVVEPAAGFNIQKYLECETTEEWVKAIEDKRKRDSVSN